MSLRDRHDSYMAGWRADGRNTVTITCPHCDHAIDCPAPERDGETWDTLALCPDCECLYLQIATCDQGLALAPEERAA